MNLFITAMGPWQMSIIFLAGLVAILFPLIAIIDILKKPTTSNNKLLWIFIVLCSNVLGSILYFMMGRKQLLGS